MNYQAGMRIPGEQELAFSGIVFATAVEAEAAGAELMDRWTLPTGYAAVETDKPVNARFDFDNHRVVVEAPKETL